VILSQTLQATHNRRKVLEDTLRIGERAIVSIPNFGHWRVQAHISLFGRMPVTKELPYTWYDTPNIHFCTIRDFVKLYHEIGVEVESATTLNASSDKSGVNLPWAFCSVSGQQAVYLLRK
jgi:methionine biosynthesis protein MetW